MINKFRIKLFLLTTVSLVIPVLLCCVILFTTTENTVKLYTSNNIAATLKANVQNIESKLDVLDSASTDLLINLAQIPEVTSRSINIDSAKTFRNTQTAFTVQSSLIVDTYTITGFNYFYLYFPNRSSLIVSRMSFFDNVNMNTMDCLLIPDNKWGVSTPYNYLICNPILGKYMTEKNFSKNFPLIIDNNTKVILTANLSESYISKQLVSGLQTKPDVAIIMDSHGNLLSSMNAAEIGHSVPEYQDMFSAILESQPGEYLEDDTDHKHYMINWEYSQANDWYYITALDVTKVTQSISSIFNEMYVMLLALLILSLSITVLLIRSTIHPLNELTAAMTEIKNKNFKVQLNANERDEFGVIYSGFNEMAKEIDGLVDAITEKNNVNTETHIRLLQSQINPHMLYNTLESLYSMAKINNQEEIATLVMAMSKFFRISLSGGKRLVPLRDALELAKQYIAIQNIRFNYTINFSCDVPDDLLENKAPKFLLQPLVENSVLYGFKNRFGMCDLKILAWKENDDIHMIVQDSGSGISEAELHEIKNEMLNFNFEAHNVKAFALRNINYQIKLEFGDKYGIQVESVYGESTTVHILLPITCKQEE